MRGKQGARGGGNMVTGGTGNSGNSSGLDEEEDEYVASVKARPPTPIGITGGGFWLAAVQASATGPPHGTHPMETGLHMDHIPTAETGFINSQPSMAEFMTALPHISGDIQRSMSPPPGNYPMSEPISGQQSQSGVNVPEYPWMKEKKTSRKSNQQGLSVSMKNLMGCKML
ncbi:conserved hypothetical protein [Pediculus humanus corporis]|uniref:Uncharacterized protein n=1 Tax=Pediculus humanus subsp. corporis TaxID=121224 RepID=E0VKL0_PEDHC|nr:uncharacterized protein Phum_PHUM266800 [Pediculus humanus corporis]EEB13916.1 conserved hypothetical protein [Pediculus humanus corporis]